MRKLTQKDDIQALLVEKRLYIKNNDSYHRVKDIKYPIYGNIFKFECDDRLTYITEDYMLNSDIGGVFVKEKSPYGHPVSWTAPTPFWTDVETAIYWDLYKQPNEYLTKIHKAMQRDEENKIFEQITNKTMSKQEIELKEGMTARVEGCKVIIETLDLKFKTGDFVTCEENEFGNKWIMIWNGIAGRTTNEFCGYCVNQKRLDMGGGSCLRNEFFRPSTKEDQKILISALAEKGKRWDAEKMQIVDIEWKPKAGDVVTTISPRGKTISIYKSGKVGVGNIWNFYASIHHSNGFRVEEKMMDFFGDVEIRLSTYDERCTFFARLVAEGYKWNAKKLKLTKVEKWSPADGDFIVAGDGTISVLGKRRSSGDFDVKCRLFKSGVLNAMAYGTYTSCFIKNKATDSERQKLLDALAKAGKRWNAELKMVENIKPEYKEGDFLRTKIGGVFIYKHKDGSLVMDHAFLSCGGNLMMDGFPACCMRSISGYATDEQKQKLIDALAKDGKIWNATKKRIEDIKPTVVEMTMEQVCEKLGMNVKIVKR